MKPPYYPDWRNPNSSSIPVQVAWAETPKPPRKLYHILEPGDVLQAGDEFWHSDSYKWTLTDLMRGFVGGDLTYRRSVKVNAIVERAFA